TLAPFALRIGELLNATGPLREISPEPPPVVRLAPTAMFPLPPFTVRVMAPLAWAPALVSIGAFTLIPPTPLAVLLKLLLAESETVPPRVVMEALTVILFPALPKIPAPLFAIFTASENNRLLSACRLKV